MTETPFSWSAVESPHAGAPLPLGTHSVRGWAWPKPGNVLVNVRARIGERVFEGVHGLPRTDVALQLNLPQRAALAGFEIAVDLDESDDQITLEALGIDGRWSLLDRVPCRVAPAAAPPAFEKAPVPLTWLDFVRATEAVIRRADGLRAPDWRALARETVATLPAPRELRHAPAPFIGFVDEPAICTCARYGRIPAFGHLFHSEHRIARVLGTVDLQILQPLEYGRPSPGPAAFYAQQPHAVDCGFAGFVDVPAQLPNPIALRIYAELPDGSLHLTQVVRTVRHDDEAEKIPLAATAGEFDAVVAALREELSTRAIRVPSGAELDLGLARLAARVTQRPSRVRARPLLGDAPASAVAALPRSVILASHALTPQGAPRFLLDLARALISAGVAVHVVTPEHGPLHGALTEMGARISVIDLAPAFASGEFTTALAPIPWSAADIVVANTFTTFWAVHAARAAGRPSLLYIHESTTPAEFYGSRVSPGVLALAEESITAATAVSFTTAATARYHGGRQRLTPGWIDVAALDRWRAEHPWASSRARLDVPPSQFLVCNIGTVSGRKGQHAFVRAIDLLWRRFPRLANRARFVLLGGRNTLSDRLLADVIRLVDRPNLFVHPETADYLDYYQAADLLVCSSYEESSPRVVLEAMAMSVPILASSVHGVPELVRGGQEANLLPPGDTAAWCEALARHLSEPWSGRELAANARTRVLAQFDAATVLPRHVAMIGEISHAAL